MAHKFSRRCPECGCGFATTNARKLFCSPPCQKTKGNRDLQEGLRLVTLIKAHRMARNTKDPAKRELAARAWSAARRLLDESNAQDRLHGRTDAMTLLRQRDAIQLIDLP